MMGLKKAELELVDVVKKYELVRVNLAEHEKYLRQLIYVNNDGNSY